MKRAVFFNIVLCVVITTSLSMICCNTQTSQTAQPSQTAEKLKTKLELFQAKTGAVIIRNYSEIGTLTGPYGGSVAVTTWEFLDAQSGKKEYGLSIEIKESGSLEREDRSFVDFEEIDSLVKGIDYIAKIDKSVTKLNNFEAHYRTKGDLDVVAFNNSQGTIGAGISVGYISPVKIYFDTNKLQQFKSLVLSAKSTIDQIRK